MFRFLFFILLLSFILAVVFRWVVVSVKHVRRVETRGLNIFDKYLDNYTKEPSTEQKQKKKKRTK